MYVTVIHDIRDSEKFWKTVEHVVSSGGIPNDLTVHATYPDVHGGRAVCLWEAESLAAVKQFVEATVGPMSDNEYFEVQAAGAVGLPA